MTAQPEVVWVWHDEGPYWTVCDKRLQLQEDAIPYVPQASLTAALAERDAFEVSRDFWKRGWAEIDQQHATASAERDKLAKALIYALNRLEEGLESPGTHEPDWSVGDRAFIKEAWTHLTAQAAQGEKG